MITKRTAEKTICDIVGVPYPPENEQQLTLLIQARQRDEAALASATAPRGLDHAAPRGARRYLVAIRVTTMPALTAPLPRSSAPLLLPETMAKGAVVKVGRARAPPV